MSVIVNGKIIKGNGIGEKIGFPTLNLAYSGEESGVYAGVVFCNKKFFRAAIHIGVRPTINDSSKILEAYLFDFSGKINDEKVRVELLKKIRETRKFSDLDELKSQISKDVEVIKQWFLQRNKNDV